MLQKIILSIISAFLCLSNSFANEVFLSLKKDKVNVRYGPNLESPIKYVYKKINLPIKQIDKNENFRRIIDVKNNSGWIHVSQLKQINSIIPLKDKILFQKPSNFSKPLAKIKKGRILIVKRCDQDWCQIKTSKFKGWIKNTNIWGKIK
tara:strand:+ start:619 stop:1065 length:447 start_codon:yes stop_codon:yes gene_type:complete